ncbi:hypothetical protein IIA16_00215 [bacterium]|nr:hypothetical protein [bacterium]
MAAALSLVGGIFYSWALFWWGLLGFLALAWRVPRVRPWAAGFVLLAPPAIFVLYFSPGWLWPVYLALSLLLAWRYVEVRPWIGGMLLALGLFFLPGGTLGGRNFQLAAALSALPPALVLVVLEVRQVRRASSNC